MGTMERRWETSVYWCTSRKASPWSRFLVAAMECFSGWFSCSSIDALLSILYTFSLPRDSYLRPSLSTPRSRQGVIYRFLGGLVMSGRGLKQCGMPSCFTGDPSTRLLLKAQTAHLAMIPFWHVLPNFYKVMRAQCSFIFPYLRSLHIAAPRIVLVACEHGDMEL